MNELILDFLLYTAISLLIILGILILATPVIFIISLFKKEPFMESVKRYYKILIEIITKIV